MGQHCRFGPDYFGGNFTQMIFYLLTVPCHSANFEQEKKHFLGNLISDFYLIKVYYHAIKLETNSSGRSRETLQSWEVHRSKDIQTHTCINTDKHTYIHT